MSTPARERLMRDFKRLQLQHDSPAGISGAPYENNRTLWNAVIFGPDDTGGTEVSRLDFGPKTVSFPKHSCSITVYVDGTICLDILQNQWSPIYDVAALLTSVQSLLCDPNPNSPVNSEAAKMYRENKREYNVVGSWSRAGRRTRIARFCDKQCRNISISAFAGMYDPRKH